MRAPGCVVIFKDIDDLLVLEILCELGPPLLGAAGVCRSDQAERGQIVGVFLTLGEPYRLRRRRRQQFWQAIRHHSRRPATNPMTILPILSRKGFAASPRHPHPKYAARISIDVARDIAAVRLCPECIAIIIVAIAVMARRLLLQSTMILFAI